MENWYSGHPADSEAKTGPLVDFGSKYQLCFQFQQAPIDSPSLASHPHRFYPLLNPALRRNPRRKLCILVAECVMFSQICAHIDEGEHSMTMQISEIRRIARRCRQMICWMIVLSPALVLAQRNRPENNPNFRYNSPQVYINPNASAAQLWQQAEVLVNEGKYYQAMPVLLRSARMGNPHSQAMLGIIYQDGDSVQPNDRTAAYWFGLAAAQGHRAAEYELGAMYEEGEGGLPKNEKKAMELYEKSAAQGFDKAQLMMGVDYELGDGVPRSRPRAIQYLRASGGQGVFIAQVLANPHTPARFANARAFGDYLARIENAEFAASWRKATGAYGHSGGLGCVACKMLYGKWQESGGGDPVGPQS